MQKKLIVLACIVLIGISYILFFRSQSLGKENSALKEEIISLNSQIDLLEMEILDMKGIISDVTSERDAIAESKEDLEDSYVILGESYKKLDNELGTIKDEVKETIEQIEYFQKEIDRSMQWFSFNSKLDDISLERYLGRDCIKISHNECTIKLSCIEFTNSQRMLYEYLYDIDTSVATDKLQSLDEFIKNKGGDCEDYSLFYKAEFNHLKEMCGDKKIILETWIPGEGDYFVQYDGYWYLPGAVPYYIEEGFTNPIVVCGNMYDPVQGTIGGHCLLGFTEDEIEDAEDLKGNIIPLVEPQNGLYVGTADLSGSSAVHQLITDKDMFLYRNGRWMSYSGFQNLLDISKDRLNSAV